MALLMVYVLLAACIGFDVPSAASNCEKMAAMVALEDGSTVVDTSLKMLAGTWISEGCETRPGPEYVLRYYTFEQDGRYFLTQHHYWDDSCSSPLLSVHSYGRIQLRNSLMQPGAASGAFKVSNITVTPQDDNAARELDRTVSMECPGQTWMTWRKYEEHIVYNSRYDDNKKSFKLWLFTYKGNNNHHSINSKGSNVHSSDISCLGSLKWAFNELKLLKIQLRPMLDHMKKLPREVKMELLLGDIHSNFRMRQYYNPTSFQVPLIKQIKEPTQIFINRHTYTVKNTQAIPHNIFANPYTPPHMIEKPHLPPYIWGVWTSIRCESRTGSLYLTRRFSFYSDETWIGEHNFYSDPFCRIPKFIVTAAGHFKLNGINKELKGTSNIDFQIERASLTVLDQKMIFEMRLSSGHCGEDEWQVNVPKELSTTGGCMQLGIILPSVQYDVVKVEMDYKGSCLLFLGQVDTDNIPLEEKKSRPSAFQLPLVKCGEVPTFSQGLRDILNEQVYGYNVASTNKRTSASLLLEAILLLSCYAFCPLLN